MQDVDIAKGLSPANALIALGTFFDYTDINIQSDPLAALNEALQARNVIFASVKDINASEEDKAKNEDNHFVIIRNYNADGSFTFYDPQLGKMTNSKDEYYGKITEFAEIKDLNPDYAQALQEAQDAKDREEQERFEHDYGKNGEDLRP